MSPQADAQHGPGSSFWRLQGGLFRPLPSSGASGFLGSGPLSAPHSSISAESHFPLSSNSSSVLAPAPTLTSASCSRGPTGRGLVGSPGCLGGRGVSLGLGRGRCRGHDSACHAAPGGNSTGWQLQKQAWKAWVHRGLSGGLQSRVCTAEPQKTGKAHTHTLHPHA